MIQVETPTFGKNGVRPSLRRNGSKSVPADFSVQMCTVAEAFERFGTQLNELARKHARLEALEERIVLWSIAKDWRFHVLVAHRGGKLEAAIMLRERLILGLPTGYFVGADHMGEICFLCDPAHRRQQLRGFIDWLFKRKAFALHLKSDDPHSFSLRSSDLRSDCDMQKTPVEAHWRHQLAETFDGSIAQFGKRTRRNLRHSLRAVGQNGWHFREMLTEDERQFAAGQIDKHSTYPASSEVLEARAALCSKVPGFFTAGLQAASGEWLSTVSGVRGEDNVTRVSWQHNANISNHSLCTVMRALLIDSEVARGSRRIEYIGGTNALMEHYCDEETATRTIFVKRGIRFAIFRLLLSSRIVPSQNVLKAELHAGNF